MYPPTEPGDPPSLGDLARQELAAQGLSLTRADNKQSGDYYVLRPTPEFVPVPPGNSFVISLKVELWGILKTDSPAAWHIVFDGDSAYRTEIERCVLRHSIFFPHCQFFS